MRHRPGARHAEGDHEDFISLLDTMHQNPDVTFSELVEGRTVTPDRDPDDDLIEDLEV